MKNSYRFLEHTADMGLEIAGRTLEELFANAAEGLRDMVFGFFPPPSELTSLEVTLDGMDSEELLVGWLNEILYLFETRNFVPFSFHVKQVTSNRMSASVYGVFLGEKEYPLQRQVKAVTYHQLMLKKTKEGWRARLFVDL